MPVIPKFNIDIGISSRVPEANVSADSGAIGRELQNLGNKGVEFFTELAMQRKKANDDFDATQKYIEFQREWQDELTKIKTDLTEDGTMDPAKGYALDERGNRQEYNKVVEAKTRELLERKAENTVSFEAETRFRSLAEPARGEYAIKADGETQAMKLTTRLKFTDLSAEILKKELYNKKDLDPIFITQQLDALHLQLEGLFKKKAISQPVYEAKTKEYDNAMATATMDNFLVNNRPEEIFALLELSRLTPSQTTTTTTFPKGVVNEYPEIQDETIKKSMQGVDNLEEKDIVVVKQSMEDAMKDKLAQERANPYFPLVHSLTYKQAQEYYEKAMKMNAQKAVEGLSEYHAEMENAKRMSYSLKVDDWANSEKAFASLELQTNKLYKNNEKERILKLSDIVLYKTIGKYVRGQPQLSYEEQTKQLEIIRKEMPNLFLDEVFKKYPEANKYEKELKTTSFRVANITSEFERIYKDRQIELNKILEKDSAGYANMAFPEITASYNNPDKSLYLNRMNYFFKELKVPEFHQNVIPDEEIDKFCISYEKANAEEKVNLLMKEKNNWGKNWIRVKKEYMENDKIPFEARIAITFSNPNSMAFFLSIMESKNRDAINANFSKEFKGEELSLNDSIQDDDGFKAFKKSIRLSSKEPGIAERVVETYEEAVMVMAKKEMLAGKKMGKAVDIAMKQIPFGNYYIAQSNKTAISVPIGTKGKIDRIEAFLEHAEKAEDFKELGVSNMPSGMKILNRTQEGWYEYLEVNSQWVNTKDQSGIVLMVYDNNKNKLVPVLDKKNKPIRKTWDDINNDQRTHKKRQTTWGR